MGQLPQRRSRRLLPGLLRAAAVLLVIAVSGAALAQDADPAPAGEGPVSPPVPAATAVVLTSPVTIDGRLDDAAWAEAPVAGGFTQREPHAGRTATEPTEFRVLTDDNGMYWGIRMYDDDPAGLLHRLRARDSGELPPRAYWSEDDSVAILLDTFHDRRNAYYFAVNPNAARTDALMNDEGLVINFDWDGVWQAATTIDEEGWTAEIFLPWTTLRFGPGEVQDIGVNVQRMIRRKTEETFWAPIDLNENLWWVSRAGRLDQLEVPSASLPLEVRPYVASSWLGGPAAVGDTFDPSGGADAKIGITHGLALDLTLKTDFAQVEVDEEQVNLTRFPLLYPEKREFFLENAGLFDVGIPRVLNVFFSRRIGLDERGQLIPILAGARLTGRAGGWEIGVLDVQTEETPTAPTANNAVVRVRRPFLERSTAGFLVTNIQTPDGRLDNRVFSGDVDINWRQFRFNLFAVKTSTPGIDGDDLGYGGTLYYNTDTAAARLIFYDFGEGFNPGLGYLRRSAVRNYQPSGRIGFRPGGDVVRRVLFRALSDFTYDHEGTLVTRSSWGQAVILFDSDDQITVQADERYELLDRPFVVHPGTIIPAGEYHFIDQFVNFQMSRRRPLSGSFRYLWGGFFDGDRTTIDVGANLKVNSHLALLPAYQRNDVRLPEGNFVTNLGGLRINVTPINALVVNAFLQYNDTTERVSTNLRLDYIYRPGSDLFVVYNETRDLYGTGLPIQDRQLVFKLTYLWRR